MAKQKKKRNKKYHGADAKVSQPSVVRVSAEERGRVKEWWLTYGKLVRFGAIAAGIVLLVTLFIVGIIGIVNG